MTVEPSLHNASVKANEVQLDTVVMAVGRAVLCAPPLANPRGRIRHARRARSDSPYQRRFCPLTSNSGWLPQTTTTVSRCTHLRVKPAWLADGAERRNLRTGV